MKNKIFICLVAGLITISCKKILEPKLGETGQVGSKEFYTDFNGALQGINGVYPSLQNVYRIFWNTDVLTDDAQNSSGGDQQYADFEFQSVQPPNTVVASIWNASYNGIYRANVYLDRASEISGLQGNQAILKNQFLGEAYFIRALHYYNLVMLYGDVPLITTELTNTAQLDIGRSSKTDVFAQIEKDLLEALKTLPVSYPNTALLQPVVGISGGSEVGRVTAGAAKTLLGYLYLTTGNNVKAEQYLKEVVNSGVYSLNASFTSNFTALGGSRNSSESILEAQFAAPATLSGAQTDFSFQFGPADETVGGVNSLARNRPSDNTLIEGATLNNTLVQAYAPIDLRKNATISYNTVTPVRSINKKYWVPGAAAQGSGNWVIFRYADAILLLAEALQNQGKDGEGLVELNKVHAHPRTGLTPYAGVTGTGLRDAIRLERRLELAMEGRRFIDLMRWNTMEAVMAAHGRPVKPNTKGLLPIPQGEIEKSTKFIQNPGY